MVDSDGPHGDLFEVERGAGWQFVHVGGEAAWYAGGVGEERLHRLLQPLLHPGWADQVQRLDPVPEPT